MGDPADLILAQLRRPVEAALVGLPFGLASHLEHVSNGLLIEYHSVVRIWPGGSGLQVMSLVEDTRNLRRAVAAPSAARSEREFGSLLLAERARCISRPGVSITCRSQCPGPGCPYEDLDAFVHRADELAHSLLEQGITGMKIWPFDPVAEQTAGLHISGPDLRRGCLPSWPSAASVCS